MFIWIWFNAIWICKLLQCLDKVTSFRIVDNNHLVGFLRGRTPFRVNTTEEKVNPKDGAPPYVNVELPVKALWNVISEHVISKVYRANGKSKALPVILSCSGGQDSMSLLHCLGLIKHYAGGMVASTPWSRYLDNNDRFDLPSIHQSLMTLLSNTYVVYFDHGARPDTDKDIDVIRSACEKYGLKFHLEKAESHVKQLAHDDISGNFQKCARDWRREAYRRLIDDIDILQDGSDNSVSYSDSLLNGKIFNKRLLLQKSEDLDAASLINEHTRGVVLMGHHSNDNVETFLFKLLRGVHLSNMTGMERMSYLDDMRDIVVIRPFIQLTKSALGLFLEGVNGTFHEDSSNNTAKYTRNRIRQSVLPELLNAASPGERPEIALESLNKRFCNLSAQSRTLKNTLDFEAYMFSDYISSKYGVPNHFNLPESNQSTFAIHDSATTRQVAQVYRSFYHNMYSSFKFDKAVINGRKYIKTLQFLRSIGLETKEVFFVDEWLMIQSELLRKDILYKFCLRTCGEECLLSSQVSDRLYAFWSKEPNTDAVKMHVFPGGKMIAHQGTIAKPYRPTCKGPYEPDTVYNDGHSIFRIFDNFKVQVMPAGDRTRPTSFHLMLTVPLSSGGEPTAFDIRQLRDDDIVPSDSLWNRTASSVLSKMNFPQILRDELPVIALKDSNHVICFYGVNIMAPYYDTKVQKASFSFGKDSPTSNQSRQYVIKVLK